MLVAGFTAVAVGCTSASSGTDAADSAGDTSTGDEPVTRFVDGPLRRFVDPMIGTGGRRFTAGSAYPGPALPFAMVHPGPDTGQSAPTSDLDRCSGYNYGDDEILAFSHTRMHGTGAPAYGGLGLMPAVWIDWSSLAEGGYRSSFSHDSETSEVGYYRVILDREDIAVELTSTDRVAVHRYTYPGTDARKIIVDPSHVIGALGESSDLSIALESDGTIVGHSTQSNRWWSVSKPIRTYFAIQVDTPIEGVVVWDREGVRAGLSVAGDEAGMVLNLGPGQRPVVVKVGISFSGIDGAKSNLRGEVTDFDFDGVRRAAQGTWEQVLKTIEVSPVPERDLRNFYTAVYHAHLMPTLFSDVDGQYRGLDGGLHMAAGYNYYSDFSLWDTFRSQFGLVLLTMPDRARDFMRSLEAMTLQGGAVPRWVLADSDARTMVGDPAALMVAEAYAKGLGGFDAESLFSALLAQADGEVNAHGVSLGREVISDYTQLGYVPEQAATSLEYYYADWALAGLAEALGRGEVAQRLRERSQQYRHLWDDKSRLLRPRERGGEFVDPLEPTRYTVRGPYVEGTAEQWLWYVPHDPSGLASLFGSRERAVQRLSEFFTRSADTGNRPDGVMADIEPYYWHGNEPSLHTAYLFSQWGRRDLTQAWVRAVLTSQYDDSVYGLPGNDDSGTLSAWYVLSSLGLYPVAGSDQYWWSSPTFERAIIHRTDGDIEFRASELSVANPFAIGLTIGDQSIDELVPHDALRGGAVLRFDMGAIGERVPQPRPRIHTDLPDAGQCDDTVGNCCGVTTALAELPACVATDGNDLPVCGLDVSVLDGIGLTFDMVCQAKHQAALEGESSCPVGMFDLTGLLPTAGVLEFTGCCRAATRTCGVVMDRVAIPALNNFQVDVDLGCVTAEPLLAGEPELPCGP